MLERGPENHVRRAGVILAVGLGLVALSHADHKAEAKPTRVVAATPQVTPDQIEWEKTMEAALTDATTTTTTEAPTTTTTIERQHPHVASRSGKRTPTASTTVKHMSGRDTCEKGTPGCFLVTCYDQGTTTKSGTHVHDGTFAVDRSVIPLGSHIMVGDKEGWAEDIGGAVIGNHVDEYRTSCKGWGNFFTEVSIIP